jgi:hypothetical protein
LIADLRLLALRFWGVRGFIVRSYCAHIAQAVKAESYEYLTMCIYRAHIV